MPQPTLPSGALQIAGRRYIVTGAASGIGRGVAAVLLQQGAHVAFLDLAESACAEAARALDPDGTRSAAVGVDVRDAAAVERAVQQAEDRLGPLDGLVAAAGISVPDAAVSMSEEVWRRVIDTNLNGLFFSCQAVGRRLCARGQGAIVTLGSTSSLGGHPGRAAYCASKFAVNGLTKVMAQEWGHHGVRVNAVGPNAIDTPMVRKGIPEAFTVGVIEDRTPLGRVGQPAEVAHLCAFLLSDFASYITGALMPVDGGLTAGFLVHDQGRDLGSTRLLAEGTYRA